MMKLLTISVLAGALATLERCHPLLVLEASPSAPWIASMLAPLGYRVDGRLHANIVLR